ncbi:histidine phosphatase family protein [Streptomyces otsuchiensis]|uniref:histidine phosphatase family protein n=1 Tax=Streptomyces otsuchiensis TaxID=2681388 RepID=UPI00102F85D0|nr:histidine phosphatase family protein [Streptomyces otsuchiensis]
MRLLLIRHGQTPSNVRQLLDTAEPGPGLTPLGQRQAEALPAALAGEEIGALYASNLTRAQQTAEPLATRTGLEIQVRDGIRELSAGELEMRGDESSVETYLSTVFAWSAGDTEARMPGGENGEEALSRFDAVVREAAGTGVPTVAMVSHGAAIRMWAAARADNVDVAFAAAHHLENTGVVVLSGTPDAGWHAERWADRTVGRERGSRNESGPAGDTIDDA